MVTPASCLEGTATIKITAPSNSGIEYSIFPTDSSLFSSKSTYDQLTEGTYILKARNADGCTSRKVEQILAAPNTVTLDPISFTDATCDKTTGKVTINVKSGSGTGFTYSKDGGATTQPSNEFANLPAGDYTFLVENGAGCKATATAKVSSKTKPDAIQTLVTPASCLEGTATIKITAPSNSGIEYSIFPADSSSFSSKSTYDQLTEGTYILKARNADGCTSRKVEQISAAPKTPTFTASATNVTCGFSSANSDGKITLAGFAATEKFDIVEGATYTGSATYATATSIPVNGVVRNNIENANKTFTIRVFNATNCYIDRTVTLNLMNCTCPAIECVPLNVEQTIFGEKR